MVGMGRFANLEQGAPPPAAPSGSSFQGPIARARNENDYLGEADEALRAGRAEKALRAFSRALEFNPNLVQAWTGQLRALLDLGELAEAKLWASKALELFRDHPDLLAAKACACLRLGEVPDALGYCDAATESKGAGPFPWLVRGEVALHVGRGNEEHCFHKARELARGDWFMLICIARVLMARRLHAQALDWATKAATGNPRSALAWVVLGQCREHLALNREACTAFHQAVALDRDCPGAQAGLTRLSQGPWYLRLRDTVIGWFP